MTTARGLTLIELIVAGAILIVLAGLLVNFIAYQINGARVARLVSEVRSIRSACVMYFTDMGILAAHWTDLIDGQGNPQWRGPYLDKAAQENLFVPPGAWDPDISYSLWYEASPWKTTYYLLKLTAGQPWTPTLKSFSKYNALAVDGDSWSAGKQVIPVWAFYEVDRQLDDNSPTTGYIKIYQDSAGFVDMATWLAGY